MIEGYVLIHIGVKSNVSLPERPVARSETMPSPMLYEIVFDGMVFALFPLVDDGLNPMYHRDSEGKDPLLPLIKTAYRVSTFVIVILSWLHYVPPVVVGGGTLITHCQSRGPGPETDAPIPHQAPPLINKLAAIFERRLCALIPSRGLGGLETSLTRLFGVRHLIQYAGLPTDQRSTGL